MTNTNLAGCDFAGANLSNAILRAHLRQVKASQHADLRHRLQRGADPAHDRQADAPDSVSAVHPAARDGRRARDAS
ncbi:MAG: pentapeptide repeat-containing protein [Burkholderiales bacterium]